MKGSSFKRRGVEQLAVQEDRALGINGTDPMNLLGNVDAGERRHGKARGNPFSPPSSYIAMVRGAQSAVEKGGGEGGDASGAIEGS